MRMRSMKEIDKKQLMHADAVNENVYQKTGQ